LVDDAARFISRHRHDGARRSGDLQNTNPTSSGSWREPKTGWAKNRRPNENHRAWRGAWGTALAKVLHENGNAVTLWDIATDTLEELRRGRSEHYLPGCPYRRIGRRRPILEKPLAEQNAS